MTSLPEGSVYTPKNILVTGIIIIIYIDFNIIIIIINLINYLILNI